MPNYFEALENAMGYLAAQPDTVFVGQSVAHPGTAMYNTLAAVPADRRVEFPVAEDFQLGFCLGMALEGLFPVSIFPRWDFLLLAANQLVHHADKVRRMSGYRPRMAIRTGVGSARPLDPGPQHKGDFTDAFAGVLGEVRVRRLEEPGEIEPAYVAAYAFDGITLLVEVSDYLNEK